MYLLGRLETLLKIYAKRVIKYFTKRFLATSNEAGYSWRGAGLLHFVPLMVVAVYIASYFLIFSFILRALLVFGRIYFNPFGGITFAGKKVEDEISLVFFFVLFNFVFLFASLFRFCFWVVTAY